MSATKPVDAITLELIKGAVQSARREMEALIDRTSMSPFIREKKDYFTAIFDADGQLVVSTALTHPRMGVFDTSFNEGVSPEVVSTWKTTCPVFFVESSERSA